MGLSGHARTASDLQRTLYDAAERATLAPSILNSQPWRWRVHRSTLDLIADSSRQVRSVDPDGRMLVLSCGAALHHADIALRMRGLEPRIEREPDRTNRDLLARIRIAGPHPVSAADRMLAQSIGERHSDRRPIAARAAVDAFAVDRLGRVANGYGARLHLVTPNQRTFLATAAANAQKVEATHEAYQHDLVAWTDDRMRGEGVPKETMVSTAGHRPVPLRDFAGGGETGLHPGWGDDAFADYLVVSTPGDGSLDWLRAGEAMSAVWLEATVRGIVASVISDVIEVPGARALVAALLPAGGHPQIVLRIGISAQPTPPPATPRREPSTIIELDDLD